MDPPPSQRRWPRALSGLGFIGCVTLAVTLPGVSVIAGLAVLDAGILFWRVRKIPSPFTAEGDN